jgi:hypothetical protein
VNRPFCIETYLGIDRGILGDGAGMAVHHAVWWRAVNLGGKWRAGNNEDGHNVYAIAN